MKLIHTTTLEYPITRTMLKKAHPGVMFPKTITAETVKSWGYAIVREVAKPATTIYQKVVEDPPVRVDGTWTQQWRIVDLDGDELAAVEARLAQEQADADLEAAKLQLIQDNLPSWSQVETIVDNISTLAEAKAFLKKLARINYLFIKERTE